MDNDDKCDEYNDDESDDEYVLIWLALKATYKENKHHVPYVFVVMEDDE